MLCHHDRNGSGYMNGVFAVPVPARTGFTEVVSHLRFDIKTRRRLSMHIYLTAVLLAAPAVMALNCTTEFIASIIAGNGNATVNYVYAVAEGTAFGVPSLAFPTNATNLPAVCAVGVNVQSSGNSSYNFGLFLPDSTWNERFLTTGNGGYGGGINWPDMGIFSHYGFATMSTDTGHNASGLDGGSWGLDAPEALIDWGHRAMHGSVELSKTIVTAYYSSEGIQYSYYASCSTGGRQGLREVQLYPDDFDGISVGAPGMSERSSIFITS